MAVKKIIYMKKISCLVCGLVVLTGLANLSAQLTPNVQPVANLSVNLNLVKGTNVFGSSFNKSATGRQNMNAYLMCYLNTLIYPQYLSILRGDASDAAIDKLHGDKTFFEGEFKKHTSYLFSSPQYKFVTESFPLGYDPEAMVISTSDVVYVVFRGTDRVATNAKSNLISQFMYDWGEWLLTDFDATLINVPDIPGQVHRGFWNSLSFNGFKDKLVQQIKDFGGANKKVWISGHSLGSAHAQLFSMYLAKKGIVAQGVYLYAAPHPGTQDFVDGLNLLFPSQRLQRFDFSSDPITMLAPYTLGYRRAGTRVFYKDIKSIQFAAQERSPLELAGVLTAVTGAVGFNLSGSEFCYHHPTWYLRSAYTQLTTTEREKVPIPLPLPDATTTNGYSDACDQLAINKGRNSALPGSLLEQGLAVVGDAIEKLSFAATTVMDNVTGAAISEGDYYIKSYPSGTHIGLNETNGMNNGSGIKLSTTKQKVKIQRFGTVGYTIRFGTKTVDGFFGSETKEYVLDSKAEDLFDDGATTIQLWEKNSLPGLSANQRWLFIKLRDGIYLIKNIANGKLLDANNSCINTNECGVKTWNPISNDQTQIWILEKQ